MAAKKNDSAKTTGGAAKKAATTAGKEKSVSELTSALAETTRLSRAKAREVLDAYSELLPLINGTRKAWKGNRRVVRMSNTFKMRAVAEVNIVKRLLLNLRMPIIFDAPTVANEVWKTCRYKIGSLIMPYHQ
jgi:hypothetical protein